MPYEVLCRACGAVLHSGQELKSARRLLKRLDYRCPKCGAKLSPYDFELEVERS